MVYSAALIMTKSPEMADDIAQDIFLSLWEHRQKAAVIGNIQGFLYNNVKFLVHKRLRRLKVEDAYTQYLAYKARSSSVDVAAQELDNLLTANQMQETIRHGIAELPPQQQRAFRLSRDHGLSHEQISALIGVSKKTVKDYIVRSIAFLRQHLAQHLRLLLLLLLSR